MQLWLTCGQWQGTPAQNYSISGVHVLLFAARLCQTTVLSFFFLPLAFRNIMFPLQMKKTLKSEQVYFSPLPPQKPQCRCFSNCLKSMHDKVIFTTLLHIFTNSYFSWRAAKSLSFSFSPSQPLQPLKIQDIVVQMASRNALPWFGCSTPPQLWAGLCRIVSLWVMQIALQFFSAALCCAWLAGSDGDMVSRMM